MFHEEIEKIDMEKSLQNEFREYVWKYFSPHAEQRLKTFHFFVILSVVLTGAILTITKEAGNISYAAPLAYLLAFFAFIFWKLDVRNKELIKHGENALKNLETCFEILNHEKEQKVVRLFMDEERKTNIKPRFPKALLFSAHMSYSNCFNAVFCVFGVGGCILGTMFVLTGV
uniref:SMODS and SLOG-associating 2TM effector domain-containing protein n=1 Tax=Candidatus Kentrum sp. UNK TaxID=2126344 RepID=A0A451A623_9GAMM|nr:MAG: hypothetical protein BECKUNK1418G_GA0071005_101743 [Candidatus Kentron sp. UNK]VFK69105.1 MAG: hypothetical protein BECKUNK1418H_GA0071006_101026 [Candidatus Kentron sp. UNK]